MGRWTSLLPYHFGDDFMPTFHSLNDLMKYLETQVENNIKKIGEEVKSVLRNFILQDLYMSYTPLEYQRTMDFLNAVECSPVKKNGNIFQVEIYINPDKLRTASGDIPEGWLPHTSSLGKYRGDTEYEGKSIGWWLIYWFETGDNTSPFSRGKIGMFEKTRDWIEEEKYLNVRMKELFEKNGIPCI